jgi:hypothetical protein
MCTRSTWIILHILIGILATHHKALKTFFFQEYNLEELSFQDNQMILMHTLITYLS